MLTYFGLARYLRSSWHTDLRLDGWNGFNVCWYSARLWKWDYQYRLFMSVYQSSQTSPVFVKLIHSYMSNERCQAFIPRSVTLLYRNKRRGKVTWCIQSYEPNKYVCRNLQIVCSGICSQEVKLYLVLRSQTANRVKGNKRGIVQVVFINVYTYVDFNDKNIIDN